MKDAEFNPMELRRMLMDIDRHCDTAIANLSAMPPSKAGLYAVGALRALGKLAQQGLVQSDATEKYKVALGGDSPSSLKTSSNGDE